MLAEFQIPFLFAILMEAFVSIHMSLFLLKPLSQIISSKNSNKVFWILFILRIVVLLIIDIFVTTNIAIIDFMMVFVGVFIILPIAYKIKGNDLLLDLANSNIKINNAFDSITNKNNLVNNNQNIVLKCSKCGAVLKETDNFCQVCGTPNQNSINNQSTNYDTSPIVTFDNNYNLSEKEILKKLIIDEFKNQEIDINSFTTTKISKKNNILLFIFGLLTFINILLYYFNYTLFFCGISEIIIFLIYFIINKKNNILDEVIKEVIKNPDLDITSIVSSIKGTRKEILLSNFTKIVIIIFITVFIPTMIFFNPRIIYTKYGEGYQVFRYTRGIINNDEVIIPKTYKEKIVLAIGERAFKNSNVKKVTLPDTIESIKIEAFKNARNIETLTLPSSLVEIRAKAFQNMTSLRSISLPEGLKDIRGSAFANDINLTDIKLPSTLEYLGGKAFSHCSSITELTIPNGVTEINGQTFEYMSSLKKINLHDNITYIHGEVFKGDTNLNDVVLPSKITEIKGSTFENCSSLTSIIIPDSVTRIGGHAFYGCSRLNYVYVPNSVLEIGSSAFRQCYSLNNITISRNALVNERAFKESPTLISYYEDEESYYE